MTKTLKIVLAQLDFHVGDIQGNLKKSIDAANTARDTHHADLIVFPELNMTGYSAQDMLNRASFLEEANQAVIEFKNAVKDIHSIVCHPHATTQGLFNACSLIYNDKILTRYSKQYLPNYGVFDEKRYFVSGNLPCVVPIKEIPVGIIICEDVWHPLPARQAVSHGARILVVSNASPFEINKHEQRYQLISKRAKTENIPIAYVNCVGAQDDVVFDGGSMVVNAEGELCQFAGFCQEKLLPVDFEVTSRETNIPKAAITIPIEEKRIYDSLVLGVKDYFSKNGFTSALIGISGGIDSALTAAIAVDALGHDNVHGVVMPSRYTSEISMEDGLALINNLKIKYDTISIEPTFKTLLETLEPHFNGQPTDVTEENLQARCRGIILMALSNKHGKIVLSTGNRSEMATGFATLYGDMCGGLAVLKDVTKTWVYRLAKYRNQIGLVIPLRTIERAPTAELAPNQKDEDTLPPYPILDQILELYMNEEKCAKDIIALGFDAKTVHRVIQLIHRSEYKRRQAPIGIRINHKAFGADWRYPVTLKLPS